MSRVGKSVETEGRLRVARGWGDLEDTQRLIKGVGFLCRVVCLNTNVVTAAQCHECKLIELFALIG